MKASELRIGNWVDNAGTPRQIKDAEELLDVETFEQFGTYSPLPLTSEWLERFGFEHENTMFGRSKWSNEKMNLLDMKFYFDSTEYFMRVQYVHQLQNLYFALIGEELTIKDDGKKEGKEQQESSRAESQDKDSLE